MVKSGTLFRWHHIWEDFSWNLDQFGISIRKVESLFDDKCEKVFQILKDKLCTDPVVLAYMKKEGTFILDTDASLFGVGGVLSQIQENGREGNFLR